MENNFDDLRRVAEERLASGEYSEVTPTCESELRALLHELQVHQVELEMQNEELHGIREGLEERVERRTRELTDANARLASILESITDCHISFDSEWRILEVNPPAARLVFGRPAAKLVGTNIWTEYPQAVETEFERSLQHTARGHGPAHFETQMNFGPGRWFEGHAYSRRDRLEVYLRDITERKAAEEQQQEAFYRRTILVATQGKLMIIDRQKLRELAENTVRRWHIDRPEDVSLIVRDASTEAQVAGMDGLGINMLITCILEASSNVLKHAGTGEASICRTDDSLLMMVEDRGPGIGAMSIPDVALLRGYSTAGTLGMGYKLMIASCRRLHLATGPEGTSVAFDIPLVNPEDAEAILSGWTAEALG